MKKETMVLALLMLIMVVVVGVPNVVKLATVQVGPEGIDAHVHGVEWTPTGVQYPYVGGTSKSFSTVSKARPNDVIGWTGNRYGYNNDYNIMRWDRPDPYNPNIELSRYYIGHNYEDLKNSLVCSIRTRQAEVHEINTRGDPLGTRSPTEIVWYQWESKTREEQVGTTTEIEWTRHEAFVVPVDYVVEISVRALKDGSWGAFEDLHLWYVMDTVRWYNAFAEPYGQLESGDPPPEGAELKAYNYRGAFPIWAWIDTWDPFVYEDEDGSNLDLPSEVPDEMQDYLQISPSIEGSRLTLYHEADWEYVDLYAKDIVADSSKLQNALASEIGYLPDPRFAETVFTPITLTKFGAYHYADWGFPIIGAEHWFYPTAYLRVRALYVVWGQWIYLWTHEEAEEQDYEWQNRSSTIYVHESAWNQFWGAVGSAWGNLVSNPLFWFWLLIIGGIIFIVLVLVIMGPSAFVLLSGWLKQKSRR